MAKNQRSIDSARLEMNAESILKRIVKAMRDVKLEAILIGNAAAALNGAPVTTLDFDFFVRDIEKCGDKLEALAKALNAAFIPASSPMSNAVKIENEEEDLFLDFIDRPAGMKSFASVRSRSEDLSFDDVKASIHVASLKDVIASKNHLRRPKDLALLPILETTLDEKEKLDQASQ